MDTDKKVTRREFLKWGGLIAGGAALAAVTPRVAAQAIQQTPVSYLPIVTNNYDPFITPQGKVLPADAAPVDKQVFTDEGQAEPLFFDGARDIYSTGGLLLINETLIHNDENQVTVPSLAESWKAGPNTTYWEFTIQQGAVWSDGVPITADDIVYTFVHLADPSLANPFNWFYYPIKGVSEVSGGGSPVLISDPLTGGVRKVDDRTVRIYGEGSSPDGDPCPYMLGLLSYQAAVFVPMHIAAMNPLHWADNGVGLVSGGPYLCTKWEHNVKIEYSINPKYNRPQKPYIQHVVTPIGIDSFTAWLNKEVDLLHAMSPAQVATIRTNSKLNPLLHFFSNFESQYLSLNTFVAPLNNRRLRQALSHAIDRVTLCGQVLNGTYSPGYTMLPPGFPAYNKALESVQAYDVPAAQQLLSDAGYPGGKDATGTQLTLEITDQNNDPRSTFIAQQWATNLGIKVTIKEVDGSTWRSLRSTHGMPIFNAQYEYDYIDPANLLTMLFHSDPISAQANNKPVNKWGSPRHPWYNAQYDQLCDQAGTETDVAKRIAEYQQAETIQVTDCGQIFLTHQLIFQVWYPWIVGIPANKDGDVIFRWLDITRFQMYIHKDVNAMKAQY